MLMNPLLLIHHILSCEFFLEVFETVKVGFGFDYVMILINHHLLLILAISLVVGGIVVCVGGAG